MNDPRRNVARLRLAPGNVVRNQERALGVPRRAWYVPVRMSAAYVVQLTKGHVRRPYETKE